MDKVKFSERKMEAWTGVVYMHSNDLWLGVKSLSNLAMAGSCWNMPKYSLAFLIRQRGKARIIHAEEFSYGELSNSELVGCLKRESVGVRKVLSQDQNNGDHS